VAEVAAAGRIAFASCPTTIPITTALSAPVIAIDLICIPIYYQEISVRCREAVNPQSEVSPPSAICRQRILTGGDDLPRPFQRSKPISAQARSLGPIEKHGKKCLRRWTLILQGDFLRPPHNPSQRCKHTNAYS
jgi:hypothetical protein